MLYLTSQYKTFFFAISQSQALVLYAIVESDALKELFSQVERVELGSDWAIMDGLLLYKGRIYLLPTSSLISTILSTFSDSAHESIQKTVSDSWGFLLEGHEVHHCCLCVCLPNLSTQ